MSTPACSTPARSFRCARGTTLVETLIGLALMSVLVVTTASLLAFGRGVTATTRRHALALALARARLEELEGLTFARETPGPGVIVETTDLVTDLSAREPAIGGAGLDEAPADALHISRERYVDYLDSQGRWAGRDARATPRAAFVRRWRVRRLGAGASEIAAFEVLVAPAVVVASVSPEDLLNHPEVVRLVGARARRAR